MVCVGTTIAHRGAVRIASLLLAGALGSFASVGCASSDDANEDAESSADAVTTCNAIGTADAELAVAGADGEAILTVEARAQSKTSWAEAGNEALVLEVSKNAKRLGHLVLHQGSDAFAYTMHTGTLAKGDRLTVKVSPLSAPKATKSACVKNVKLEAPKADMAEGLANAPILKWPAQKSFNDLPAVSGWSRKGKSYQVVYTNEDGGTVSLCGGGADGMRSEIARWGRGVDIEGAYSYGGGPSFERCGGDKVKPRMESAHPVLYYGNGHNNLFESRGGYGDGCGTRADAKSNGDLEGWNKNNPGNDEAKDDPFTIVLRPAPVDLDAIGYREDLVNAAAPWLYRILDSELKRENKVDGDKVLSMDRYLYVDVHANDVGGSGDGTCGPIPFLPGISRVTGGFKLRAVAKNGTVSDGPQMTKDYFGGNGNGVKRIAIPLKPGVQAADIEKVVFDAYDDDGIYFLGIGDAFVPRAAGTNGAVLDYVSKGGIKRADVYVDDNNGGCTNGKNTKDGKQYTCVGSAFTLSL